MASETPSSIPGAGSTLCRCPESRDQSATSPQCWAVVASSWQLLPAPKTNVRLRASGDLAGAKQQLPLEFLADLTKPQRANNGFGNK